MEHTALAVNQGWLNADSVGLTTTNCLGGLSTLSYSSYCQPWTSWTYPSPARPIKLTLSDIDRLRKAARADKALKTILAKFTDQIEITVDFE